MAIDFAVSYKLLVMSYFESGLHTPELRFLLRQSKV